jgi:hypothetical protein
MNPAKFTIVLSLLMVATAQAGSEHLVKQKAKDVRDQQNERQGVRAAAPAVVPARPASPTQPTVTPYAPRQAAPAVSAQAATISDTLGVVQQADPITEEQTRALAQSLSTAARGSTKPSANAITKLANDLSNAIAGVDITASQRARLAGKIETALNEPLTAKEMETLATEVHDMLRDAGAGRVEAKVVSNDLRSIIADNQRGGSR